MVSMPEAPLRGSVNSVKNTVDRSRSFANDIGDFCEGYLEFVLVTSLLWADAGTEWLLGGTPVADNKYVVSQIQTILTVVVIAVVAIVGILIYSEIESSISVGGDLETSKDNVTSGFGDAMELVPIVLKFTQSFGLVKYRPGNWWTGSRIGSCSCHRRDTKIPINQI